MFRGITLVSWSRKNGQAGLLSSGAVWSGVVWALMSTTFICSALMLWVFMTASEVYHFSALLKVGIGIGALLGGTVSGKTAGYLGWLHGVTVGFIYFLAVLLLLVVWSSGLSTWPVWFGYGLALLVLSAAGGIAGVNISAASRGSSINYRQRKRFPV